MTVPFVDSVTLWLEETRRHVPTRDKHSYDSVGICRACGMRKAWPGGKYACPRSAVQRTIIADAARKAAKRMTKRKRERLFLESLLEKYDK